LDFTLSHGDNNAVFEQQLDSFLSKQCRRSETEGEPSSTSDTVERNKTRMLKDLRNGRKICRPEDINNIFRQSYTREAFKCNAKRIKWDQN